MSLEPVGAWLWDKYGKEIVDKLLGAAKKPWENFRWDRAATEYHGRLKEQHSKMRVLGKPGPVSLEGIFTDAYILDRPTALRRFDIEQLKKAHDENRPLLGDAKRINALQLAKEKDRLFILGKPGAGKTTFLRYLTLQALDNKIEKIPIFVSLHEWSNSGLDLMAFVVRQFEICAFPDASLFIEHVLNKGWAMMLFDGLDEVKAENEQRARLTTAINDFVKQYPKNKHLITCRIAASDYAFDGFTDVEIADFDDEQVKSFGSKWFSDDPQKGERFLAELGKPDHRGLRELAKTPLLLALLCLAFEDTLTFPPRRNEIYEEALEALLKKWDASRNIERDDVYRALSLGRKRQMFARIAAEYFEQGEIFFRQDDLAQRVESFVARLPAAEASVPDGETILKAIERQHSIFVERAYHIYSFSHLTLQEYFTARYIVDNAAEGTLSRLISHHLTDRRWREVFLLTAGMLSDADTFFRLFREAIDRLITGAEQLIKMIKWATDKALDYKTIGHPAVARASALATAEISAPDLNLDGTIEGSIEVDHTIALAFARGRANAFALDLTLDLALALTLAHDRDSALDLVRDRALTLDFHLALILDFVCDRDNALDLIEDIGDIGAYLDGGIQAILGVTQKMGLINLRRALQDLPALEQDAPEVQWRAFANDLQAIMVRYRNIGHNWNLTDEQRDHLEQYNNATILLAECLQVAAVSNRKAIEESLLLPPGEWTNWITTER